MGELCAIAGCQHDASRRTVTFAAPDPMDGLLREYTVAVCVAHHEAIVGGVDRMSNAGWQRR